MLIPETVVLFAISTPSKAQLPPQDLAGSNSQCEEDIITGIIGCCTPWPNGKEVLSGMPSEKRRKQNLNAVTYFMGRFPILSLQLCLTTSVWVEGESVGQLAMKTCWAVSIMREKSFP